MQDDKLDIQKILQDAPDEAVEPVDVDQDTDDSDAAESVEEPQEVSEEEPQEVAEEEPQEVAEEEPQEAAEEEPQEAAEEEPQETAEEEPQEAAEEEPQEVAEEEPQEAVALEASKAPVETQPEPKEPAEPLTAEEKKQRVMKVLVPLLLVAFIFMAKKSFFPSPKESLAQKIQPAQVVQSNMPPQWQLPDEYPSALRDPMRFGSVTGGQYDVEPESLVLKGIIFSSTPAAIVSGKIVKTGDEIMGATIVEIKRGSVVFRSGDRQWEQKVKR